MGFNSGFKGLSATRRIECGGGFLWTPYVPQRNDGTID